MSIAPFWMEVIPKAPERFIERASFVTGITLPCLTPPLQPGPASSSHLRAVGCKRRSGVVLKPIALGRIALEPDNPLGEVNGSSGPYLKTVHPRVGLRRREQGHVLAQASDRTARLRESDTIGVE